MGSIIILVYRRRQPIRMVLNHIIRSITLRIPHPVLWRLCWIAKPLGKLVLMFSGTKYVPTVYKEQKVSMEVSKFPKIYRILARFFSSFQSNLMVMKDGEIHLIGGHLIMNTFIPRRKLLVGLKR